MLFFRNAPENNVGSGPNTGYNFTALVDLWQFSIWMFAIMFSHCLVIIFGWGQLFYIPIYLSNMWLELVLHNFSQYLSLLFSAPHSYFYTLRYCILYQFSSKAIKCKQMVSSKQFIFCTVQRVKCWVYNEFPQTEHQLFAWIWMEVRY